MKNFKIFSQPSQIYANMLYDVADAKKSVYLETYIYDDDEIGNRFRMALTEKAREGVKVLLLIDAWGSSVNLEYFKELINSGGEVRFFREMRYVIRMFSKNHERNHRKLLIIDENVTYVGSANITASCIGWLELVLRVKGKISNKFAQLFVKNWGYFDKHKFEKAKTIVHRDFSIIHDVPNDKYTLTQKKYISVINDAKREICIETPYFVPSSFMRRALYRAVERGVSVQLVLPYISDVKIMDLIRNRYLGKLYRMGVKIRYYKKSTLHSKLLIVDDTFFLLGSSNLDYRSFIHQHEINLFGTDRAIAKELEKHFSRTLKGCVDFKYEEWKQRSSVQRIAERLLFLIKEYL